MLISHEVPLCLLEESRGFNDYDYALVHLFEKYEKYYDFFKESIKKGRKVILDNSIFELETPFDSDIFVNWITKLKPTEYVVPDSLENIDETITNFDNFILKYKDIPGIRIGVVQGKNYKELQECYNYMSDKADKIGISFDYSCLLDGGIKDAHKFMDGRIRLLKLLKLNKNKPHHLLGNYLPQEWIHYRDYNFIDTIDTSNPVVHAIKGIKYEEYGLNKKESIKLVDLIETPESQIDKGILYYNLFKFRKFVRG